MEGLLTVLSDYSLMRNNGNMGTLGNHPRGKALERDLHTSKMFNTALVLLLFFTVDHFNCVSRPRAYFVFKYKGHSVFDEAK